MLFINTPAETPKAAFLNNIFVLDENSEATVSVQTLSLGQRGATHLHHCVQQLVVKENAKLNLTWTQMEDHDAWQFTNHQVWLSQAARVDINHVDIGSAVVRHSLDVVFNAELAHCELNGLNVLKGSTQAYHHIVMNHDKPNNTSEQFYKSILDDHTRAEFNGTVKVAANANGTDAHQLNKNLLLSDDAHAFARPQLQILADDLKCNHGATVGQLDKTQLFYMISRGLEPELAECLLTYGFAEEMIEKLPLASLRSYVNAHMLTQLDQHNNPLACHVSCHHCE
jgi:Fe-S cluster assembly protein SufD